MGPVTLHFAPDLSIVLPEPSSHRTLSISRRLWPSSLLLCSWLALNRSSISGRRVLDLGSGSGICGLLAARLGAEYVVLQDVPGEGETGRVQRELFEANGLSAYGQLGMWWGDIPPDPIGPIDLIISSDTFYEQDRNKFLVFILPDV